jgi:tol-pal system protein YbgF
MFKRSHLVRSIIVFFGGLAVVTSLQAALFEDDEARKAILDLRQRVETLRNDADQTQKAGTEERAGLGRGLLDLQRQTELLRSDLAILRGANEQLAKELADLQRLQKDGTQVWQGVNERLVQLEPMKVSVDGQEFLVDPAEKRNYESALAVFRRGDFLAAKNLFIGFLGRYSTSGYALSSLFWLGNAQYATKEYQGAMVNFRALIARNPEHLRAPESVLSVANCQLELKDTKGARKTLEDLMKAYPQSEAAIAAKERLASLK